MPRDECLTAGGWSGCAAINSPTQLLPTPSDAEDGQLPLLSTRAALNSPSSCFPPLADTWPSPINHCLQFIDSTGAAKIADFGLARILSPAAMACLTGETGSYLWMAPEVIR